MATPDNHFGWFMECVEKYEMLGPSFFLQLLLLQLAFQFPFNTNPNFSFKARKSACVIYRNGLHWVDMNGIDLLVELQRDFRAVIFVEPPPPLDLLLAISPQMLGPTGLKKE